MKRFLICIAIILLYTLPLHADKGPIIWQENVTLSQGSQKAIVMHNGTEENLTLATEMKATQDVEVLEFIPFPSLPSVSLAKGDPFGAISGLIKQKDLVFLRSGGGPVKGGHGSEGSMDPVEILVSRKIGLHDVTVVKINDAGQFKEWCEKFFSEKGIRAGNEGLSRVYDNARDYTERGYTYFVFDRVKITRKMEFIEPLSYSFKSPSVYYPLKTSNLIGGTGTVELIFLLPGSFMNDMWRNTQGVFDRARGPAIELSSSSKVYRSELHPIVASSGFFPPGSKIYIQVLRYKGAYMFKDDFTYDLSKLRPYAFRFESSRWHGEPEFSPEFTQGEVRDLKEFFCPKSGDMNSMFEARSYNIDCWSYIPREEYEVYAAVFKDPPSGIPGRHAVIEKMTSKKELKGTKLKFDKGLVKDFNEKNRVSYPLENGFPDDGAVSLSVAGGDGKKDPFSQGKTYVSRVGFNRDRSMALVHVDHIAGPRSGAAYYVTLERKGGDWTIVQAIMEAIY